MGLLLDSVLSKNKDMLLQMLQQKNVEVAQSGKPILDCDVDELMYEWVLVSFKEIDISADANKFF